MLFMRPTQRAMVIMGLKARYKDDQAEPQKGLVVDPNITPEGLKEDGGGPQKVFLIT